MSNLRQITVYLHWEDDLWWAESPTLPGFSSAADSLTELRKLTKDGINFALKGEPHYVLEISPFVQSAWGRNTTFGSSSTHELTEPEYTGPAKLEPSRSVPTTNPRAAFA